ncbi:MAG: YceI family protein [Balneolaceae bacterium]
MKKLLFIIAGGLLLSTSTFAQTNYNLVQEKSQVTVSGTSSLHDWEIDAEKFSGLATITIQDGNLEAIDKLNLTVEVESIISGKRVMDGKVREAFDAKKNPLIIFELNEVTSITADSVFTTGKLTMAGVTNTINLAGAYTIDGNGILSVTGSKQVKMTDYKIDPPRAMMGTIKTGDEVEIVFSVDFSK